VWPSGTGKENVWKVVEHAGRWQVVRHRAAQNPPPEAGRWKGTDIGGSRWQDTGKEA